MVVKFTKKIVLKTIQKHVAEGVKKGLQENKAANLFSGKVADRLSAASIGIGVVGIILAVKYNLDSTEAMKKLAEGVVELKARQIEILEQQEILKASVEELTKNSNKSSWTKFLEGFTQHSNPQPLDSRETTDAVPVKPDLTEPESTIKVKVKNSKEKETTSPIAITWDD